MDFLIIALVILGGAWALASVVNNWEAISNGEPLGSIKEGKMCQLHSWKKATFLNFKDFEEYKKNPSKFEHLKTDYCQNCGFVPSYNKMVVPKFLNELKAHQKRDQLREQRERDIENLKAEFLKAYLEEYEVKHGILESGKKEAITLGFEAYDTFLCHLPKLVQARELGRILGNLEDKKI